MKTEITESIYNMALSRIEELLPQVNDETSRDDPRSVELCLMSDIVVEYEKEHFPISKPAFNDIIRLRLEEENMQKQELASQVGISPSRISDYISGKAEPTLRIARSICKTLNIRAEIALGL